MPCPIVITKFVGTISLGLLTGISYTLSSLTLPTLTLLPTASHASLTLSTIRQRSTRTLLSLSTLSAVSLLSAYLVSPRRSKHPYLVWTAIVALVGGPGCEWWFNGRFESGFNLTGLVERLKGKREGKTRGKGPALEGEEDDDTVVVNGESVERDVERDRKIAGVRMGIWGLGFTMGIVGIWGDGA